MLVPATRHRESSSSHSAPFDRYGLPPHISNRIPQRGCNSSHTKGECLACPSHADCRQQGSKTAGTAARLRESKRDSIGV